MKNTDPIKIVIADTSFIIRKGLKTLIRENNKFVFIGEASDCESLELVLQKNNSDLLIVEHGEGEMFSSVYIGKIINAYPELKILVISFEKSMEEIKKIINLGIRNYLLKDCGEEEIIDALLACNKGEKYFCRQIIDILLEKELSAKEHCLTGSISDRELEVIKNLVTGKRPKEIAAQMDLSYHTIVTHKRNIYSKLGINNSIELARYAIKTGIMK